MNCPNLIAICSKTHLPCPHCQVDGKCDEAACSNSVVPTWREMLDIYQAAVKPTVLRYKAVEGAIRSVAKALGTTLDAKVIVSAEDMDAAYAKMLAAGRSPDTVKSYFNALNACTGNRREVKMEYHKRAKQAPTIDAPSVKIPARENCELTDAQRLAIRDEMSRLRTSDKRRDHDRFVWLWFAWYFGVRESDIEQLTWACIRIHSSGKWWLDYVPSKTAKKTRGRRAGGVITTEQYEEIRQFVGKPEEYVITRHHTQTRKGATHGEYVGRHDTIRKYVIAFMQSIGVTDRKPQYALRKDCSQQTIKKYGVLREAQLLGHTPKVATENYVNFNNLELGTDR